MRGADHTIRMAPDYGVDVPLWPRADETDELVPEDLLRRLMEWQTYWDHHHQFERGWDSDESRVRWRKEGADLASELKDVLPRGWKLKIDF
jgi:hypothetical protein